MANGVQPDWLTLDEEDGKAPEFVCGLDQRPLPFVGEEWQESQRGTSRRQHR